AMIDDLVNRSLEATKRALQDAGKRPGDIHEVVLVGGSTRIPLVRRRVGELFGLDPYTALDPDQAIRVAMAHAILALVPQPTVVNVTAADSEAALKRLMDLRKWSNQ
ncbi:Hsp70 family protein, partial [uncultured Gordonia sp.]|uniref:Hsp70 family protein n=1 Tax=uncultured Gordonia sp. TaxID=198437 RepID=UPI0026280085